MIKRVEPSWRLVVFGAMALFLVLSTRAGAEEIFDHALTGFELSGGHKFAECESCHIGGQFEGTQAKCVSCHSVNGRVNATPKPINHINTSEQCESCHNVTVWNAVPRVDHVEVFGTCNTCHNPNIAPGAPFDAGRVRHSFFSSECSDCHSDLSWQPARFSHDNINPAAQCADCHNSPEQPDQPMDIGRVRHSLFSSECSDCHSNLAWLPPRFSHDYINPAARCADCHNNGEQRDPPPDMPPVRHAFFGDDCSDCHSNMSWKPVQFTHDVVSGECVDCHASTKPTNDGPRGHIRRMDTCADCHISTAAWAIVGVNHEAIINVESCADCHLDIKPMDFGTIEHSRFSDNCDACHDYQVGWPAVMSADHDEMMGVEGNCASCHTGDQPHPFFGECSLCHQGTIEWQPGMPM
jgi:Class III cytochrome C family